MKKILLLSLLLFICNFCFADTPAIQLQEAIDSTVYVDGSFDRAFSQSMAGNTFKMGFWNGVSFVDNNQKVKTTIAKYIGYSNIKTDTIFVRYPPTYRVINGKSGRANGFYYKEDWNSDTTPPFKTHKPYTYILRRLE